MKLRGCSGLRRRAVQNLSSNTTTPALNSKHLAQVTDIASTTHKKTNLVLGDWLCRYYELCCYWLQLFHSSCSLARAPGCRRQLRPPTHNNSAEGHRPRPMTG